MFTRAHGDVFGCVVRRRTVGGGVDAEQTEVARVPWPLPVVGVSTEFTDGGRGGADEANVRVFLSDEGKILIAVVERFDQQFFVLLQFEAVAQITQVLLDHSGPGLFAGTCINTLQHPVTDVLDPFDKGDKQTGVRLILPVVLTPKTILQ